MGCNTAQNEVGGKSLLLKACVLKTVATANTSNDVTLTAHGLVVGDIIKFLEVGANTVINTTTYYFVVAVPTANTFEISATRGGAAIVMDATEASLDIDAYLTVGGLRSKSLSFNSEAIDITNGDSDEWKVTLDGAGIRSMSISGSGVYTNESVFRAVELKAMTNALTCLMFIDVKNDRIYDGCYKITSIEQSGDYDAEGQYSLSAESSGEVVVTDL